MGVPKRFRNGQPDHCRSYCMLYSPFYPTFNNVFVALGAGIDVYVSFRFGSELAQNNPPDASVVVPQKP